MSVFHTSVRPVTENEFRQNIVKVVCGSTGLSAPLESASTLNKVLMKIMISNRTDAEKLPSIC